MVRGGGVILQPFGRAYPSGVECRQLNLRRQATKTVRPKKLEYGSDMLAVEMTRRDMLLGSAMLAVKRGRLEEAVGIIQEQTASQQLSAATLVVHHQSGVESRAFGKALNTDAVFLLASLTKPMTASALMILVDRKQVSLTDRVQKFIPEFRGDGREQVLVKHLLTHTSGLPDMLPNNEALRKQHAPLSEFVAFTCRTPLLFVPGSEWRYQSMGILLAGEIVSRVSREPLPDFLREHVYRPLGMSSVPVQPEMEGERFPLV